MGSRRATVAVAALCAVQFVDVLGVTVVVTALPAILADLGAGRSAATVIAAAYATFFGALLMLGARLGDRHGPRPVLLGGLAAFAAGSVLAATAPSVALLVAARCLQGAAAAASVPAALRLLNAATGDEHARRRALAAWSAAGAVAGATGFLLGGVVTDLAGWRAVFWLNVPIAAVLIVAVRARVPAVPGTPGRGLDLPGAALLTATVMGVVIGSSLLEQPADRRLGAVILALSLAAAGAVVAVERRARDPLLPRHALRHLRLRVGVGASFANTATTSSVATLAALYLQQERGLSPAAAGLWLLPVSIGAIAGAALAAPALARLPRARAIGLGLGIVAAGDGALLALPLAAGLLPLAVGVAGLGLGLSSVAANAEGTDVEPALQAAAGGALNTAAQIGAALGVAALLLVAGAVGERPAWALAAVAAAAAGVALARAATRPPAPGAATAD